LDDNDNTNNNNNNNSNSNNNNNNIRTWNKKCMITPAILGATGIVTKILKKKLEATPEKHSVDSLQDTSILGTSHITRL
jgi:hypothetical protein